MTDSLKVALVYVQNLLLVFFVSFIPPPPPPPHPIQKWSKSMIIKYLENGLITNRNLSGAPLSKLHLTIG